MTSINLGVFLNATKALGRSAKINLKIFGKPLDKSADSNYNNKCQPVKV